MILPKKLIKLNIAIATLGLVIGYLRRLSLGDSDNLILLNKYGYSNYYWYDLIVNDLHSLISYSILGLSDVSPFIFKFIWGLSTGILIGATTLLISFAYQWFQDN